ncbi:MAG: 16S rRNA (uracil(1498)-N(3))-methyltransferase [Elusimicrobia bacterium]|nr:16S rRNA (uracil(1498)-N(3))-methyltransferase [Candidatus Obscuribacterium magneticum]
MSQFLVQPRDVVDQRFTLHGSEARHALLVLRMKPSDEILLFDGNRRRYRGRIQTVMPEGPQLSGEITDVLPPVSKTVSLHLYQGLPRGAKFDYVIEKATELGVDVLLPFLSQKNLIKLTSAQALAKLPRWRNLMKSAAKQCERGDLPVIETARPLGDLGARLEMGRTLVLSPAAEQVSLKRLFSKEKITASTINIVVGPESGFGDEEVRWLKERGGQFVSLGSRVLRSETAGLAALAILNYELNLF